jgi:hypothetical protein
MRKLLGQSREGVSLRENYQPSACPLPSSRIPAPPADPHRPIYKPPLGPQHSLRSDQIHETSPNSKSIHPNEHIKSGQGSLRVVRGRPIPPRSVSRRVYQRDDTPAGAGRERWTPSTRPPPPRRVRTARRRTAAPAGATTRSRTSARSPPPSRPTSSSYVPPPPPPPRHPAFSVLLRLVVRAFLARRRCFSASPVWLRFGGLRVECGNGFERPRTSMGANNLSFDAGYFHKFFGVFFFVLLIGLDRSFAFILRANLPSWLAPSYFYGC